MKKFFLPVILLSILVLMMGTLTLLGTSKRIPDTEIGLSKSSVFDEPAPDPTRTNQSEPGDRPLIPRGFPEQPPTVPHGVIESLPITFTENQCVDCHEVDEKEPGEPTPIPRSHYTDLRNAPGVVGDQIVGARYICVSCHVSPGDNEPLVKNAFSQ